MATPHTKMNENLYTMRALAVAAVHASPSEGGLLRTHTYTGTLMSRASYIL